MVRIRAESPTDRQAVDAVHHAAFGRPTEGQLVQRIRESGTPFVSLMATIDDDVVGHILFSEASLDDRTGMALGPMAVAPAHQRHGIGSQLVAAGLAACRENAVPFVVVLGHPSYYPRFGFVPASTFRVRSSYEVPDEVFMALELEPGALDGGGLATYHPAFAMVED